MTFQRRLIATALLLLLVSSARAQSVVITPPTTLAVGATWISALVVKEQIPTRGYGKISIGVTLSQAGTLTLQRYVDPSGQVAFPVVSSASLTAGTPALLAVADDVPFSSFTVKITNGGGSPATLTNFAYLLTP